MNVDLILYERSTMKVRWREHEIILATMAGAIILTSFLWNIYHLTGEELVSLYKAPFIQSRVPFSLSRNIILPETAAGLLVYLLYLWINKFIVPRLLYPKKWEAGMSKIAVSVKRIELHGLAGKILKSYLLLILQIALIIFLMGSAFDIAAYFRDEYNYNYTGFSFFPGKGHHVLPQLEISIGFKLALNTLAIYAAYVCLREIIINLIESPGRRRSYRILICNQVTAFFVIYLIVPFFLILFKLVNAFHFSIIYFPSVISVFAVFMSNTYWLFPLKGQKSFLTRAVGMRLLLSTFILSLPLLVFAGVHSAAIFPLFWTFQLLIVTPVSWLAFQLRKDKILELRGVQKALLKTRTDLQLLRSQINPHFLFNVLNTLYGTALQENAERTAGAIQKLGDMMRFMLHENNQDFIQMEREIEYLKNYIALQKLRIGTSSGIIMEENIDGENCNHKIAPMLLIPLVENAFKHGISFKEKSWVRIKLECTANNILFEVKNSMHERPDGDSENEPSGIGLKNVLDRLKLIYPAKHEMSIIGDRKEFFVKLNIQVL